MLKGSTLTVDPGPVSECDDFEDRDVMIMTS